MEPAQWSAPPPPERATAAQSQAGCLNAVLFAMACAWVVGVTVVFQAGAWFYDQIQLINGTPLPGWFWVALALGQALLLALPVAPLAWFTRAPRFRAAYLTWALAIGFGALFSLARLNPVTWTQPAAVVQIGLSLLAAFVMAKLRIENVELRKGPRTAAFSIRNSQFSILPLALAVGTIIILPWLHYGALGSPIDTLLDLLAATGLGLCAGLLLDRFLLAALERSAEDADNADRHRSSDPLSAESARSAGRNDSRSMRDVGFGGVAAGVALLMLGAGYGFGGSQLPLMICLLPLGGAAVALGRVAHGRAWLPIAGLVAVVAAGPLLLLDPDEFSLILMDTLGWIFRASWYTFLIALVVGLALWLLVRRLVERPLRPGLAVGGLVASVVAAALVYAYTGQPGFYGERLFVILRDQADVSQAATIADRTERLRAVYTTLARHADDTQADLRATLDRLGVAYRPYYLVNAIEVDGGPLLRAYLSARLDVDRILDSPRMRPLNVPVPPEAGDRPAPNGPQWNIVAIGADHVWDELGVDGKGIVVGESDSGVQGDHPALRDGYRGRGGQDDYNWLDPWNGTRSPVDVGGHGTHTTGTAVGRGGIGVAPGAEWIGCVNLARNLGNPPYYLDCLQFMLAPYPQGRDPFKDGDPARAAHVLNNSWGCPPLEGCDPATLAPAVRALRAAGIFVVASAGNEGPRCGSVSDPIAIYHEAFSVGAIDRGGEVAEFSSRGPVTVDGSGRVKPDIVAPGVDVLSALPGGTYGQNSGTSMAGPHLAGVVALMWSAQPKLIGDIDRTEQILRETARPYAGPLARCGESGTPNDTAGYGVVDAYAAVKAAQELP